jgi:L-ribulose-5-phosphate 3-epimerase
MRLGYNTNGLAHHDLLQAIRLLAEIGYESVAITIDHGALDPLDKNWREQVMQVKAALDGFGMRSVVETGARYLLDPNVKHEPTLVSSNAGARNRRVGFYKHAIDVACLLRSDCVSLWSGIVRDGADDATAWSRLVEGLQEVCEYATAQGVTIGFEPEPGMFIDTMAKYQELLDRLGYSCLQLTLDIGHLHCQGETPLADQIRHWGSRIVNVHLEDMRAGVHEHLMFGEGEIDFPPVLAALREANYQGGIHVELSRHSHDGPAAAQAAWDFLQKGKR